MKSMSVEECPHCAKTGDGNMCGATSPATPARKAGFKCTRPAGHEGDHIACAFTSHELHFWPRETPPHLPAAPAPTIPHP